MDLTTVFAAEEPNSFFLPGDINELYWGTAAFLIVLALIIWKVFPLIGRGLRTRAESVEEELAAAEQAQADADAEAEELLSKLGDADADAARIVEEATATAANVKEESEVRARADAEDLRARVTAEIDGARAQAAAEIRVELADQAVEAAEAVVRDNLDDAAQAQLIEQYITQVGAPT